MSSPGTLSVLSKCLSSSFVWGKTLDVRLVMLWGIVWHRGGAFCKSWWIMPLSANRWWAAVQILFPIQFRRRPVKISINYIHLSSVMTSIIGACLIFPCFSPLDLFMSMHRKEKGCNELRQGRSYSNVAKSFFSFWQNCFFLPIIVSLCFDDKTEFESWISIINMCLLCQMVSS